ncbi:MAG: hypothetical protein J6Y97_06800, partial [Prevotella sp.]|nr:hypothetical protein [Prevotella sp.]
HGFVFLFVHGFVFLCAAKLGWIWAITMSFCGCRSIKMFFLFVGLFFLGIFAVETKIVKFYCRANRVQTKASTSNFKSQTLKI